MRPRTRAYTTAAIAPLLAFACGGSSDSADTFDGAPPVAADAAPPDGGSSPPDGGPTTAECPAYQGGGTVCEGSYSVQSEDDLAVVVSCARITGNLELGADGLPSTVELPALERVDGSITINASNNLARVSLPELKEVGGEIRSLDSQLTELAIPVLGTGGGMIAGQFRGAALPLPCLTEVGGMDLPATARVDAPLLTRATGPVHAWLVAPSLVRITGTFWYLDGAEVPALTRAGALTIRATDDIALPALVTVDGVANLGCPGDAGPATGIVETALDLPALESAGGFWFCPWPALASASLPNLQQITGLSQSTWYPFLIGPTTGPLASVDLPTLQTIRGDANIQSPVTAPTLTTIEPGHPTTSGHLTIAAPLSAPRLATVTGTLTSTYDTDLPALSSVDRLVADHALAAPLLQTVGRNLDLDGTGDVDLRSLRSVGTVFQAYRTASQFDFTSLETVGAYVRVAVDGVALAFPSLTSVSRFVLLKGGTAGEIQAPALASIGEYLEISYNESLTLIDFAALASLGGALRIGNNPLLPTCQAEALRDQLIAAGWTGTPIIWGNGTGTCP